MKTIFLILLALTIQAKAIQIQANPPQPDSTVLTPFDALTGETLKGQSLSIDFVFDPLTMLPDHLFIALTLFTDCPKDLTLINWLSGELAVDGQPVHFSPVVADDGRTFAAGFYDCTPNSPGSLTAIHFDLRLPDDGFHIIAPSVFRLDAQNDHPIPDSSSSLVFGFTLLLLFKLKPTNG